MGDRPRGHRRRLPRAHGAAARGRPRSAVGRRAQAAGPPEPGRACYDGSRAAQILERGSLRVSTTEKTLNVGDAAPDFTLKTIGLKEVSLHDYKGKNVVILFYPLDWTPG
ncbi:MAG: hypothetical protein DMD78_05590 [Candidatus Rokuibacteriota bacterium]|nr:MAG: hypothetical protein DMD78_05590 [Candidatus Rokubacteria bacterium]